MGWKWIEDEKVSSEKTGNNYYESTDSDSSPSPSPFGDGPNLNPPGPNADCPIKRQVTMRCKLHETQPGKLVRQCEKTEQLLRKCVGRPVEVVESKTEYTEDDITDVMEKDSLPFRSTEPGPYDFPGLRDDIETLEQLMFGGLSHFLDVAKEMKNEFFQAFGMPSAHDGDSAFYHHKAVDGFSLDVAKEMKNEFFQAFGMPSAHDGDSAFYHHKAVDGFSKKEADSTFHRQRLVDGFYEKEAPPSQSNESAYTDFAGQVKEV